MSTIPTSRDELVELVATASSKLHAALDEADASIGNLPCVDDWTVKDLLAVRAWWTERVVDWIEAGRRGETPITPAEGYGWTETPRLNADIVRRARRASYRSIRDRLHDGVDRVLVVVDALDDRELLEPEVFAWAAKWPIARWISINTARQYTTARTAVRRALREAKRDREATG